MQACNSLKAFGAVMGGSKTSASKAKSTAGASLLGSAMSGSPAPDTYKDCPADVEQLGRHTWTFLHSTAAYYPEKPSEAHKKNAMGLFGSLPSLYPCRHCADELQKEMKIIGPPDVSGRLQLSNWLCRIHNEVNSRLGKREFDCSKVLQRWKEGWEDGHCD
jgi:FAD-linked sulfhydryl oxidase